MSAKKSTPIEAIHTGKQGRPANVRKRAECAIRKVLEVGLIDTGNGIVPAAVPDLVLRNVCKNLARCILDEMNDSGLRIVPARFLSEMALFSAEPAKAGDPSLPKPANSEHSPSRNQGEGD